MGVNLTPIAVRHETSLEALRGRTVAVDGNLELYQFLSIMRTRDGRPLMDKAGHVTSHLNGLMFRTTRLISDYDIRPVFVFDGPPPDLKQAEISRRRQARDQAQKAYEAALASGDLGAAWSKAVAATRLTQDMVEDAKRLLTYLGIPWIQAPSEGEAQAAFLARRGDVWAAASKDYDALLFGAPRLLRFLGIGSREFLPSLGRFRRVRPEVLDLEENLRALGLTREQLIDVAILVGTDFNEGVKGIGPKTAVKLLRKWGSLERIPEQIRNRLPEDVDAIRAFFLDPPVVSTTDLEFRPVREERIIEFLCDEHSFSRERVSAILGRLRRPRARTGRIEEFS